MKRTIFIGDVHGCLEEFQELIEKLKLQTGDRVISVGDLVDKGPHSIGVLREFQALMARFPGSEKVTGNHDEKALRFHLLGKHIEPWTHEASDADWAIIESMPLTWYDPELNIRVVHGGIFPSLLTRHPDIFAKVEAWGPNWRKGKGKGGSRVRRITRTRNTGGAQREGQKPGPGDMIPLGEEQDGDPFWAEAYDGSQGFVIYGHSPWRDGWPREEEYALGIDTGCVFGRQLTAAVVKPYNTVGADAFPWHYGMVRVDAHDKYAEPMETD